MSEPGFMIALNVNDFLFPFDGPYASGYESNTRNICSVNSQNTYTKAPWWTCENIQLTAGGVATPSATVGTTYIIKVGFQGLPSISQEDPPFSSIETVQAWVCYPNTVAGGASPTLVVPSMQNNAFASFSNTSKPGTSVFGSLQAGDYQSGPSYAVVSLSSWTPTQEDFLEESVLGGHTCIIANSSGQASLLDASDPNSGEAVGVQITDNSQLSNIINVCNNIYQAQRNIVILPAGQIRGGVIRPGFAFLSGEPDRTNSISTTVSVTAIDQGNEVDPVLLRTLSSGDYAELPLKPASMPPRSLRLTRHDLSRHGWLVRLICEAEELIEELLGLDKYPFGGGHQVQLKLPPRGLQPLHLAVELEPGEAPGTVHAIDITQTNANGERGGIRVGIVVTS